MGRKKSGVLGGKKINNNHSTFIPLAGKVIKRLKLEPSVTKIVLGKITPKHGATARVDIKQWPTSVKVLCREHSGMQVLHVIGITAQAVYDILYDKFDKVCLRNY